MNIGVLTQFLNSLQSYNEDLVQHLSAGLKVCHYTTLDGAAGIITGGDLWLSHLRFSNDDEELHYGHRLVDQELQQLIDASADDQVRRQRLFAVRARLEAERNQPIYIACFCEVDNLLSQWRGYAENGGGVSIEFEPAGFRAISGHDSPLGLMRLWRVFYSPEQQRKIVRSCVDYPYWPSQADDEQARFITDALQFFLPTFKNDDFRGEQERRLIFTPGGAQAPKPRFRVRGGMLVPYLPLSDLLVAPPAAPAYRLPIRSVLVGPGRHKTLNQDSLRMVLDLHGYADVPVLASSTPYRS